MSDDKPEFDRPETDRPETDSAETAAPPDTLAHDIQEPRTPDEDDEATKSRRTVERGPRRHLAYVTHSEIGLVRKNNQDSGYASADLLAVADGMGGAAAGDLASAVVIQMVRKADDPTEQLVGDEMLERLAGVLDRANEKISDLVADDPSLEGMGTTFTGAMFDGHRLGVVHIGDSRAYVLRGGDLTRLTHDHSWVQSLVDEGKITEEEAAYHPHRSLLLKVINGHAGNDPDTGLVEVEVGDRLLFCSDGLCGLVDDRLIRDVLMRHHDRQKAVDELVDEAHHEGGIDNITLVVADVVADDPELPATVVGAATEHEIPAVGARASSIQPSPGSIDDSPVPDAPAPAGRRPADDEGERYAPRLAPRRALWRGLVILVVTLAVIAAGLFAGWKWSRTQYYVGVSQGQVAIYRGIDQSVLGRSLGDVVEVDQTKIEDLPPYLRENLNRTITAAGLPDARRIAGELRTAADKCAQIRHDRLNPPVTPAPDPAQPNRTPTPTPSPATPDPTEGC